MTMALAPNPPEYLTTAQAGAILGRSGGTVLRWTWEGKLDPVGRLAGNRGQFLYSRTYIEAVAARLRDEQ